MIVVERLEVQGFDEWPLLYGEMEVGRICGQKECGDVPWFGLGHDDYCASI